MRMLFYYFLSVENSFIYLSDYFFVVVFIQVTHVHTRVCSPFPQFYTIIDAINFVGM